MDAEDVDLRNATYGRFVELGRAPTIDEVAEVTDRTAGDVRAAWRRLHDAHAIVLDERGDIRMANPFSAVPTTFRVHAAGKDWYTRIAGGTRLGSALPFMSTAPSIPNAPTVTNPCESACLTDSRMTST